MAHRQLRHPAEFRRAKPPQYDLESEVEEESELYVRYVKLPSPDEVVEGLFQIPTVPAASVEVPTVEPDITIRTVEPLLAQDVQTAVPHVSETDIPESYLPRATDIDPEIESRIAEVPFIVGGVQLSPWYLSYELASLAQPPATPPEASLEADTHIPRILEGPPEADSDIARPPSVLLEQDIVIPRSAEVDIDVKDTIPRPASADLETDTAIPRAEYVDLTVETRRQTPVSDLEVEADPAAPAKTDLEPPEKPSVVSDIFVEEFRPRIPNLFPEDLTIQSGMPPDVPIPRPGEGLLEDDEIRFARAREVSIDVEADPVKPPVQENYKPDDYDFTVFIDVTDNEYLTYQSFLMV